MLLYEKSYVLYNRASVLAEMKSISNYCNKLYKTQAGLPGDTWTYRAERERLAKKSEWFRAMLIGPLAPLASDSPPLLRLQHVNKRAFDNFFR